jgi:hypothetical protein
VAGRRPRAAGEPQAQAAGDHGKQQRKHAIGGIVSDRRIDAEREHGDGTGRPDGATHGKRSTDEPGPPHSDLLASNAAGIQEIRSLTLRRRGQPLCAEGGC